MPYFVGNKSKGFPLLTLIIFLLPSLYDLSLAMEKEDKTDAEKMKKYESKVTSSSSSSSLDKQKVTFLYSHDCTSSSSSSSQQNKNGKYKKESGHYSPQYQQKRSIRRTRTSSQDCMASLKPIRTNSMIEGNTLAEENALNLLDEIKLFKCFEGLQNQYSVDIMEALKVLLLGTFPNSLENFRTAIVEQDDNDSSLISSDNTSSIKTESTNSLELLNLILPHHQEYFTWGPSNREAIAHALTMRDILLFQSLQPTHLVQKYVGDNNTSNIISLITDYFNATSDWIAFQILQQTDANKREALILDLCYIGRWLFMQQNYHGAMQIMAGLNRTAVTRLWENGRDRSPAVLDIYWNSIAIMMSPKSNYKDYRIQRNNANNGLLYLPALNLVLSDIELTMDVFKKEPCKTLQSIAEALALIPWGRKTPNINASDLMLKNVCAFRQIDSDALWELSYLLLEDMSQNKTSLSAKRLDEWTAKELACFFKIAERIDILRDLFFHYVFTGKDLINYWQLENLSILQKRQKLESMGLEESLANTIISSDL